MIIVLRTNGLQACLCSLQVPKAAVAVAGASSRSIAPDWSKSSRSNKVAAWDSTRGGGGGGVGFMVRQLLPLVLQAMQILASLALVSSHVWDVDLQRGEVCKNSLLVEINLKHPTNLCRIRPLQQNSTTSCSPFRSLKLSPAKFRA